MNLNMMPNPASDQVLVKFNGVEANLEVMLVDALGREVYRQSYSSVNGNQGVVIPTNTLTEGLYQVRIKSKEGISSLGLQVAH
jgi:hypothetical protein